jgi:hypothetical protein
MSFVTVFTIGAMGFVLLVPFVMVAVLVLAHAQPDRSRAAVLADDTGRRRRLARESARELSRAA